MADWSKPSLGDQYANFLKYINARLVDVATQFASAPTNAPDQAIRWNPTNQQWEQYSSVSSSWGQLAISGVNFPSVTLGADPIGPLQASTKQYVDSLRTLITAAQTTANNAMPKVGGTFTGSIGIDTRTAGTAAFITLNSTAANQRMVIGYTNSTLRWLFGLSSDSETGSNTGTNLSFMRYSDTGTLIDTPFQILRSTGVAYFSKRPLFNGATPWDTSNLPSPFSSSGGQVSGDLTLYQNGNASGYGAQLYFSNGTNGLKSAIRLNSTSGATEFINSAYNAINASFYDDGRLTTRSTIRSGGDVQATGNIQFVGGGVTIYDPNGAQRANFNPGNYAAIWGGGGSSNYSLVAYRNDGTAMMISHGNGDLYIASMGWLTGIINGKAPAGVFHHSATASNCGSAASLAVAASGNTLQLTLASQNCNCNCACCCFTAGAQVLMADGSWKAIETVSVGDFVRGPDGPEEVVRVMASEIGDHRRLVSFVEDRSTKWSEEHSFWARRDGKQWWWTAGKAVWKNEVALGVVRGLKDNDSHFEGAVEFAHLHGFVDRTLVVEEEAPLDTVVYLPCTRGAPIIVNGYLVGASLDEWGYDYTKLDWDTARPACRDIATSCKS